MLDRFVSEKFTQLINFIPVILGIGIVIYFSLYDEAYVPYILALLFIPGILVLSTRCRVLGVFFLILSLGFSIAWIRTYILDTKMLDEKIKYAEFEADIITAESTPHGIKFIVSKVEIPKKKALRLNKLSLTWRGGKPISAYDYQPGDRLKFAAILEPIQPPTFPNAYDFKKQAYFNEISARGYIIKSPETVSRHIDAFAVNSIRQKIDKVIDNHLIGQRAAIVKALITGNKSAISAQTRENFSDAGVAHILAISGLHMGIIFGFFFVIIRFLFCYFCARIVLKYDVKKISALLSLLCALAYVQISGEAIPAVRSFTMYSIFAAAILFERSSISMRSVSVAAMVILLFRPESLLFPGFQMSFGAVIALVAFYEKYQSNKLSFFSSLCATSVIASIATAIFSINTFNRLSLGGVLSNLFAVPMMTFLILPLCMISIIPAYFGINIGTFSLLGFMIDCLIKISEFVSNIKYSVVSLPTPNAISFILIVLGGLYVTILSSKKIGLAVICIGIGIYLKESRPIIYISESDKVIGVNCGHCMCFNNLSSMRKNSTAFTKTEAVALKRNFKHKDCKKCVKRIDDNIYYTNGFYIINTHGAEHNYRNVIRLNERSNAPSRVIYKDGSVKYNARKNRPWS